MPHHRVMYRISGVPFNPTSLVPRKLEDHFPDFGQGRPLWWGLAVGALPDSWNEAAQIHGQDWTVEFHLPKGLKLPHPSERRLRASMRAVPRHCCLLAVLTDKTNMDDAAALGGRAVRSLLGLMRREVPSLLPGDVLWEGAIVATPGNRSIKMSTAPRRVGSAHPAEAGRLDAVGLKLAAVSAIALPQPVHRALEWVTLARSATVRSAQFVDLWLAILTLASHKQSRKLSDMTRIRRYTKTMIVGSAGVRSGLSVTELNERLGQAYRVRNRLVHRADDSQITEEILVGLEADAFELIDFELAKLGTPISA